jgi:O-antigen/teichoic acid export membrane protein
LRISLDPERSGGEPLESGHKEGGGSRAPILSSFGASGAIQLANIATGVLLARWLGPYPRGEFAAVILWPSILAAVGSLGVADATTFYTARAARPVGVIVGTALVLGAIQSIALIGIGFAVLPLVAGHYGSHVVHVAELFLVFIPLNIATLVLAGGLSGAQRFGFFQLVRIATVASNAIGLGALALVGRLTVESGAIVYLLANLTTALIATALYLRLEDHRLSFDPKVFPSLVSFGLRSHLGNVSSLLNQRLDQLLISVFLAPVQLGVYVVAGTLSSATVLVGTSVSLIAFPRIARSEGARARPAKRFIAITVVGSAILSVPIFLFTDRLLTFFFGQSFASATTPARVLLVAAVVLSTNRVLGATLAGLGRPLEQGIGELLALVATAVSLAALLPRLGLLGAAVASVIAYAISMIWMVHRLRPKCGSKTGWQKWAVPLRRLLPRSMPEAVLSGHSSGPRSAVGAAAQHVGRPLLPKRSFVGSWHLRAIPRRAAGLLPAAIAIILGFIGATTTQGWIAVAATISLALMTAMSMASWQRAAKSLISYLPFAGLLSLLLYPHTFQGDMARDLLIVTPLYLGLLASKEIVRVPRAVLVPIALLSTLAILQLFNPSLPSPLVGLIGLRGWLFFIPLMLVGARLASDVNSALRVLRVALIAGLPVLAVGLVEALALAEGKAAVLYRLYGESARGAFTTGDTAAQGAQVSLGSLHRVPSVFSYPAAYYCFCLAMLVPGYFLWRCGQSRAIRRLGLTGFVLAVICALTSGTREAFLTVPLAVAVTLYLDGIRPNLRALAASGVAWLAAVTLLHVPVRTLPGYLLNLSTVEGGDILGYGFRVAHSVTWLGLGPGTDTNAARNVAGPGLFDAIGGWQESYLVKSWIELGVPGLLLVVWMLVAVTRTVSGRAAAEGPARSIAAASGGFLIAALATSIKGAILDQAPANAYFWLFAGIAIGAHSWAVHARSSVEDRHLAPAMSLLRPVGVEFASVRAERAS